MPTSPSPSPTRRVTHEIAVDAPARTVYGLVADVASWPVIFPPTVHVAYLERDEGQERIQIWATANGAAKTWTSRRTLDADALRVAFRQEVSQPPVGGMGGAWEIEPLGDERCRVRLLHDYHAADDDPATLTWIDEAVDRNSHAELGALKTTAETAARGDEDAGGPLFTFEDTIGVDGVARDVYDFLNEAGAWEQRLPHVAGVVLEEETPGLQLLEMDTRTKDGSLHTTKSVRVCQPHSSIVYKQIKVPALMTLHTGAWHIEERPGGGLSVTSRHTVRINEDAVTTVLGPDAGLADARTFVRDALSANSLATLGHARDHAEYRRTGVA